MKKYQATIYQLQDALETAQGANHIEISMAIQATIEMLSRRIEMGDDLKVQELS